MTCRGVESVLANDQCNGLCLGSYTKFAEYPGLVALHGLQGDSQVVSHRFGAEPVRHRPKHLKLPAGEVSDIKLIRTPLTRASPIGGDDCHQLRREDCPA